MGHRYAMDGKCVVCDKYTDFFCDSCGRFICENDWIEKESGNVGNPTILCPRCAKAGKKQVQARKAEIIHTESN